jgi:hypothetical protein
VQPRRRRRPRFLLIAVIVLFALSIGVITAVAVEIRVETGAWRMPATHDFARIARRLDGRPSRTIYLSREPVELRPGEDDAAAGVSSVLANASNKPARTRAWAGGDARWKSLVKCVQELFAPFDVVVTDQRPNHKDFVLVAVGGKPIDIGVTNDRVSGLAPFNGNVIPRAVVFAFSAASQHDVTTTCDTIGMEVAHAYGLDHAYLCKDVMTYLKPCGKKRFVDADVPCGENKKRTCEGGKPTQNSYRQLLEILGARRP